MVQRYRVLGAILKADSFTIAEIANQAGVRPAYVRILVVRDCHVFEQLSGDTYRIRPTCRLELEQRHSLHSLNFNLPQMHAPPFTSSSGNGMGTVDGFKKKEKSREKNLEVSFLDSGAAYWRASISSVISGV